MRKIPKILTGASVAAILMGGLTLPTQVFASGEMPSEEACESASDPVTKGGCVATDRKKGNCHTCHLFKGIEKTRLQAGNIGPPLVQLGKRYTKQQLRVRIFDATKINPQSPMPPFGRHKILNDKEIDLVVEWMMTL